MLDFGLDGMGFDGYMVSYMYNLKAPMSAGQHEATCFGFDYDRYGYFCVGAKNSDEVGGMYEAHMAGYWNYDECQAAVA